MEGLAAALYYSTALAKKREDKIGQTLVARVSEQVEDRIRALAGHLGEKVAQDALEGMFAIEMVPRQAKWDAAPASLFDLVRGFAARVPLSRLTQVEDDIHPYLAAVVVYAVK